MSEDKNPNGIRSWWRPSPHRLPPHTATADTAEGSATATGCTRALART
jgi:hypothetical protein